MQIPEGVNLVPELAISPSEGLKSGDTLEVTFYIKNTGAKAAHYSELKDRTITSIGNIVYFYKEKEYGPNLIPLIYAPISLILLPDSAIKPGEAGKVQLAKQSVTIPEDFSGKLVVTAFVDTQLMYPETNENDNRLPMPLTVRAATLPNLLPTAVEVAPAVESFPATILSLFVTVKNTGEKAAFAEAQFLENKVSVLKGNAEICSNMRRDLVTIQPGKSEKFWMTPKPVTGSGDCVLDDKNANYWVVAEVDTIELLAADGKKIKGTIAESNEDDNRQTFQIKEQPTCSPLAAREAGKYCNIATAKWRDQKNSGEQCSHNFECKSDLCIKNKCIDISGRKSSGRCCISAFRCRLRQFCSFSHAPPRIVCLSQS
ncbi:hypothetical protein HYU20_03195 [Candidatus Woesearchaeota archaeon]|nr:hypothetical protein [Candidatus Woesearchaeota archaeon]